MKIYQVGGSVRDMIMGVTPHDYDYVVVGSNINEMLKLGFHQVGKNFPVFLHPKTKDEYALARVEIKTGTKHTDFDFIFSEDISLIQDLERRDFTCNAIAYDADKNEFIDPFSGIEDIKSKTLRHINKEHFGEDPLRILRMCRFTAQLDFNIAEETMGLAKGMVASNMLEHLSSERIWNEIEKALQSANFYKFIEAMKTCGALKELMPNVNNLWDTPENIQYHPEGNSGIHTILTLKKAKEENPKVKFALLLHDIGKSVTPQEILPSHKGHSERGIELITELCANLKVPKSYASFAKLACKNHMLLRNTQKMKLPKLIEFVDDISKLGLTGLEDFITLCRCDMLGRNREISLEEINNFEKDANLVRKVHSIMQNIKASDMPNYNNLTKDETFGHIYKNYRFERIKEELEKHH